MSPARRFAFGLAGLVVLGSALRVYYTLRIAPWPPNTVDDQFFFRVAPALLVQGEGFISPLAIFHGQHVPSAAHPPAYIVALAGVREVFGASETMMRLSGTLFGAITTVALGLLGRRLAGDRAGLLAAGIAALYPVLVTADGALMSESLYGSLLALALLAAYRLLDEPSTGRAVALGAALGLAALTRGEALLLTPLVLIPIFRRDGGHRATLVTCLTVLVVLAPWTIRNYSAFHRFVPVSTDAASAIAGANCPQAYYGKDTGSWVLGCVRVRRGNEAVSMARAQSDGISYAEHHLSRLPIVVAARVARVWEVRRDWLIGGALPQVTGRDGAVLEVGYLMYYALVALSIYGFVLLRRRKAAVWILASTFVLVTVTAVLVYGDVRFREPAELSLVVFGAVGLDGVWERVAQRRAQRTADRRPPLDLAANTGD